MNDTTSVWGVIVLLLAIGAYFLPAIIGSRRGIASPTLLFLFNLLLGWTILGWFGALIWAVCGGTRAQDAFYRAQAAKLGGPV